MDTYQLGYRWTIEGSPETVFRFVSDARTFHEWFGVFKRVEPDDPTGPLRVGAHTRCHVRALLPYTLDWDITVSKLDPPRLLETDCRLTLNGRFAMRGYVRYRFEPRGHLVDVINEQELAAERPLPRFLHPLAQAIFSLNHDWAMSRARGPLQRAVRRATPSLA
jgi:uncharacterized protein YndB with AHSA1/START domain